MSRNKWVGISCGPFDPNDLKGVGLDKRKRVFKSCTSKCEHWKECHKELGIEESKNKWIKVPATIKEIGAGIAILDAKGRPIIYKLVPKK